MNNITKHSQSMEIKYRNLQINVPNNTAPVLLTGVALGLIAALVVVANSK